MKGCGFWLVVALIVAAIITTILTGQGDKLVWAGVLGLVGGFARAIVDDVVPWLAQRAQRNQRSAEDIYDQYFGHKTITTPKGGDRYDP